MRILHVAETAQGGIARYLDDIVPLQLADGRFTCVRVLLPRQHAKYLSSDAVRDALASFERQTRARGLWPFVEAVLREVRAIRPDIIHAHSTVAGAVVRAMHVLSSSRPAIVYCPHGWAFDMKLRRPLQLAIGAAEATLAPLADRIVAVSRHESVRAGDFGISSHRVRVVANGRAVAPDVRRAGSEWADSRRKLLFIGRCDRQKGLDVLLAAVSDLQQHVAVRVIGESVVTRKTPNSAIAANSNVAFLGWQDEATITAHLASCDALVVPSRWEGAPLVALEAMRMAKPVIASAVGGLPDVVEDGATGLLVPPEDVMALRHAILTPTSSELVEMGRRGRCRFQAHFTLDRVHRELTSLYGEALRERAINRAKRLSRKLAFFR